MKKVLFFATLVSALFASCTNSSEDLTPASNMKSSEMIVYSGGNQISQGTRATYDPKAEVGYSIPDNGRYLVYYYIRIDGNIPGEGDHHYSSSEYFPRTSNYKTLVSDLNHGFVNANVEWRSCKSFSKYIYAKDGKAVQDIIVEEPTLEDLVAANKGTGDDLSGYLEHKDELHFIWYVCKKQDADHIWHIDGVLTSKDRENISDTDFGDEIINNYKSKGMTDDTTSVVRKAHVEIDVHQQMHKDWNEIKTSIHLRDTVGVEVFLPIDYQELADDFDIRVGKDYDYITEIMNTKVTIGENTYNLEASIKHEATGIRITVNPNKEALKAAREMYDDGITFEIHSYVTPGVTAQAIWDKLKNTTYDTTPYTTIFGQITSAYFPDDRVEIKK